MPFKSESQRRRFAVMVKEGKMSQAEFDEWNSETPAKIPERIGGGGGKVKMVKKAKVIK